MSNNLSKEKRINLQERIAKVRNFLENSNAKDNDVLLQEILIDLNEIESELNKTPKYGLLFEKHEEHVDIKMHGQVPVLEKEKLLSIKAQGMKNILIEGDNLASLYLLEKTHKEAIDLIYIDPPYNTQNKDFVYDDTCIDENDNFRHSKWISFMYRRLEIAQKLLTKEGVIFISIDDNENAQLKLLCDKIFGYENFIATIIWEKAYSPVNLKKHFSESHDYVLCYAKNKNYAQCNGLKRTDDANDRYKNPDNDRRGLWKSSDLSVGPLVEDKVYEITTPSGRKAMPPKGYCWRLSKEKFAEYVADNRIWFGPTGNNVPSIKRFLSEVKETITPMTIWKYTEVGHSQSATQDLKKLFGNQAVFTYPKPVPLIKRIVSLYGGKNSTVLDFFAGSGTTGQAVMELNQEDDGDRTFILCTNNENDICRKVTYERIRLAIEKMERKVAINYYRIDYIDIGNKLYYEYAENILNYIQQMVELENGIDFDESEEIAIVLRDEDLAELLKNEKALKTCRKIYLGHNVMISFNQETDIKKKGIEIKIIPDYYYGELRG